MITGTLALAKRAEELGVALVIGTTAKDFEWRATGQNRGLNPIIHKLIKERVRMLLAKSSASRLSTLTFLKM
jgi:hypothetical protein